MSNVTADYGGFNFGFFGNFFKRYQHNQTFTDYGLRQKFRDESLTFVNIYDCVSLSFI